MKNSLKGFTLIELIVVIAIIGVLAAILVPSMVGYVGESKIATANANAKLAYSNTAQWCSKCEVTGMSAQDGAFEAPNLETYVPDTDLAFNGSDTNDLVKTLSNLMGGRRGAGQACGQINSQMPKWTQWRSNVNDRYVGNYPMESTKLNLAVWQVELT